MTEGHCRGIENPASNGHILMQFRSGRMKKTNQTKNRFLTKGKLGGSKELVSDGTQSTFLSNKGTS